MPDKDVDGKVRKSCFTEALNHLIWSVMHTIPATRSVSPPLPGATDDDGITPTLTTLQSTSPTTGCTASTPLEKRQCCPINTLQALPDDVWQELNDDSLFSDGHFWNWWEPNCDSLFQWPDDDLTIAARAAMTGNLPLLAHLHEQHIDIHELTPKGNSLLILAAMSGQLTSITWLHRLGLDPLHCNANGTDALMMAAAYGHTDIVQWLVDHGALVGSLEEHADDNGNDALMYAARAGQIETAKQLVSLGACLTNCNHDKVTALMLAAKSGNYDLVKLLFKGDSASINWVDQNEYNAVHYAASSGHLEIIEKLYKNQAEIDTTNAWHDNAVILASASGSLTSLQWLEQHGVDIHHQNRGQCNALMLAAEAGHLPIIEYLYEQNEDVNKCDVDHRSALMYAVMNGHLACAQWLLAHGASPGQDENGNNLALLAATSGHIELLQWSEQQGIDLHSSNNYGRNAVFLAASSGHLPAVQWLHSRSVNLHQVDFCGDNALDAAARANHFDAVRWLYGEHVDMRHKKSVLQRANLFCHLDALQWLSQGIIDMDCIDFAGRNILTFNIVKSIHDPKIINIICWLYAQGSCVFWEHVNAFLGNDFFLDSKVLSDFKKIEEAFMYRKKFTELLTHEDPDTLKNEIPLANKKNILRLFAIECQSLDEDEVDKRLMSLKREKERDKSTPTLVEVLN